MMHSFIKRIFKKYLQLRNAPDALMLSKNGYMNFSIYRRDDEPSHKNINVSFCSKNTALPVIDLAAIFIAACVLLKLCHFLRRVCRSRRRR